MGPSFENFFISIYNVSGFEYFEFHTIQEFQSVKETIASILQQKMDKCTTEQFWATGAVTGLNVFLLTQKTTLIAVFSTWIIIILGFCVSAYAIYFIIHRHIAYYVMNDSLVEILKNEPSAPHILKTPHKMWKGNNLSGVVFYSGWVLLGFVGILLSYLKSL